MIVNYINMQYVLPCTLRPSFVFSGVATSSTLWMHVADFFQYSAQKCCLPLVCTTSFPMYTWFIWLP